MTLGLELSMKRGVLLQFSLSSSSFDSVCVCVSNAIYVAYIDVVFHKCTIIKCNYDLHVVRLL